MAVYIQAPDGDKYFLDAVFSVSYNQSGTPTEYAVESGVRSSDHYDQNQDTISIVGTISSVKFLRRSSGALSTDLEAFERGITALKKSGEFFIVSFSDNLNVLRNCLFSTLMMSRTSQTGRYSLDVTMEITGVVVANQVQTVATPLPMQQYVDILAEGDNSGAGNTEYPTKQEQSVLVQTQQQLRELSPLGGT